MGIVDENPAFDHLLHWVPDVAEAAKKYNAAGMPAYVGAVLNGFQNGAWRLDERYIEICTVTDESELHNSRFAAGLELLRPATDSLRGGSGAFTFAVNVTDVRQTAERLRKQGHEVAEFEVELEEHGISFIEVFVTDASLPWTPFFITYNPPRDEIMRQIDPSAFERGPYDIAGIEISCVDPGRARDELSALLGIEPVGDAIALPGAEIRFVPGDRDAITAVYLDGRTDPAVDIDGLGFRPT